MPPFRSDDGDGPAWSGELRTPGVSARPGRVALGDTTFTLAVEGSAPATVAYRDLSTIAADHEVGLLAIGTGPDAERSSSAWRSEASVSRT
jgi:hypothetical protein